MLERLQQKASVLVLFVERVQTVILSTAGFAGVGWITGKVVLEVNCKMIAEGC